MLDTLITQLESGVALAPAQVTDAVRCLVDETVATEVKADFLTALARKGETPAEITAFAHALRDKAIVPPLDPITRAGEILDVVGTGGDRVGTFNISTTAAILVAAAGVRVAKHGNRAVTSQTGSADVLEALGIPIDLSPEAAVAALRERGFAFFFAPRYHPAFKHIAPARKLCAEREQRTLFNFLGPLLNPARPTAQLMGVPRPELCEPLARVLQALGVRRGMVVCGALPAPRGTAALGAQYLDELSVLGDTTIAEFYQDRGLNLSTLPRESLPAQPATLDDLRGGDRAANAEIVCRLLQGEDRGPKRDAVLLNAGAALFVAGRCRSIAAGWELATELIDTGRASEKLRQLRQTG